MRPSLILFIVVLFTACSQQKTDSGNASMDAPQKDTIKTPVQSDTAKTATIVPYDALSLFIDSMGRAGFHMDTDRLKEVYAWKTMAACPKAVYKERPIILFPFPVKAAQEHFSDPKSYFFAKWDREKSTFKNGTDYVLMTWQMDSSAIKREKQLYRALIDRMGNFPCYCFRDGNVLYAVAHRQSVNDKNTRSLAERLRHYVNKESSLYGPGDVLTFELSY